MYALNFRNELDEPIQRELDKFIAVLKGIIENEHNEDGSHKFDFSNLNLASLQRLIDAQQAKGQWWKKGGWLLDDPDSVEPNSVGLDVVVPTGTYHNYAPTGIDDAIILEIDPSTGDVELTGLKALDGARHKRFFMLRHSGTANSIFLRDDDTGSIAAFRFDMPDDLDVELAPGQNVWLYYSPRSQRWTAAITAQDSGGVIPISSSGSSLLKTATIEITNAQLEAGGPLTVVAAVGGAIIVPIRALFYVSRSANAKGSNPTMSWHYEGHTGGDDFEALTQTQITLTGGEASTVTGTGTGSSANQNAAPSTTGGRDYRGAALRVTWTAVTAGTGTATVRVTVWYMEDTF